MFADEARPLGYHVIDQHCMLVNVAHEELIAVFLGKNVGEVKAGPAMSGLVSMVPDRLDVVVDVRVYVLFALFVVDASLHDMKKVRNHATGGEALPHVVEVESPGIGQALGKNFEFLGLRMKAPDSTVNEFTVFLCGARLPDLGPSEHPMASVHPTVRAPNEAIEGFVTVMDAPTVEQDLVRTIRDVVPIGIGNENKLWWHADVDPPHAYGDAGAEGKVFGKSLFLVEHAVSIDVLENLNAVPFVRGMSPSGLIIIVLQGPKPAFEIKTKGNGFPDVGFGHERLDLKTIGYGHFGNGLIRFEKGRVASGRRRLKNDGNKKKKEGLRFHHLGKRYLFFGS